MRADIDYGGTIVRLGFDARLDPRDRAVHEGATRIG